MFVCQWSFDIPFGKQREAIEAVKAWGLEKMRSSTFRKSTNRLLVGHVLEDDIAVAEAEQLAPVVAQCVAEREAVHEVQKAPVRTADEPALARLGAGA